MRREARFSIGRGQKIADGNAERDGEADGAVGGGAELAAGVPGASVDGKPKRPGGADATDASEAFGENRHSLSARHAARPNLGGPADTFQAGNMAEFTEIITDQGGVATQCLGGDE